MNTNTNTNISANDEIYNTNNINTKRTKTTRNLLKQSKRHSRLIKNLSKLKYSTLTNSISRNKSYRNEKSRLKKEYEYKTKKNNQTLLDFLIKDIEHKQHLDLSSLTKLDNLIYLRILYDTLPSFILILPLSRYLQAYKQLISINNTITDENKDRINVLKNIIPLIFLLYNGKDLYNNYIPSKFHTYFLFTEEMKNMSFIEFYIYINRIIYDPNLILNNFNERQKFTKNVEAILFNYYTQSKIEADTTIRDIIKKEEAFYNKHKLNHKLNHKHKQKQKYLDYPEFEYLETDEEFETLDGVEGVEDFHFVSQNNINNSRKNNIPNFVNSLSHYSQLKKNMKQKNNSNSDSDSE